MNPPSDPDSMPASSEDRSRRWHAAGAVSPRPGNDNGPGIAELKALLGGRTPWLALHDLHAGYGRTDVLHGLDLLLAPGQSICLVGPNGAGKSTVLNAVFGLANVHRGTVVANDREIQGLSAASRLRDSGIAYVLQDDSIFPDLTVEQNLLLGGYLMPLRADRRDAVERILGQYPRLAARRRERAGVLSGGERRLLEIARALIMQPRLLLIDEPSIGLEPRATTQVFDMLLGLIEQDGTSILLVEQNVRRGLAFADLGYVMVDGRVSAAASAKDLLHDRSIGQMFLGN